MEKVRKSPLTSVYARELGCLSFPDECSQDDRTPEKRKFSARANDGYGCLKPTMGPKDRERAVWPGQRADDGLDWTVASWEAEGRWFNPVSDGQTPTCDRLLST